MHSLAALTPRQEQIWSLVACGYSNSGIAQQLQLSQKWIDNALGLLYATLEIDTLDRDRNPRVQATLLYTQRRQGLGAHPDRSAREQRGETPYPNEHAMSTLQKSSKKPMWRSAEAVPEMSLNMAEPRALSRDTPGS